LAWFPSEIHAADFRGQPAAGKIFNLDCSRRKEIFQPDQIDLKQCKKIRLGVLEQSGLFCFLILKQLW